MDIAITFRKIDLYSFPQFWMKIVAYGVQLRTMELFSDKSCCVIFTLRDVS